MNINRRQFLKRGAQVAGLVLLQDLFPRLSFAQHSPSDAGTDHRFVFISVYGGLDVTLGLDPQVMPAGADENDLFLEYRPEEILTAGGIRLAPPAKALIPHAADCSIVNGIMMRQDAGHDSLFLYMSTGSSDGKAASIPVALATANERPMGVMINENAFLAGRPVLLTKTKDILSNALEGVPTELLQRKLRAFNEMGHGLEKAQKSTVEIQGMLGKMQPLLARFKAQDGALLDRHAIAAAFAAGASRLAEYQLVPQGDIHLDTHSGHPGDHYKNQAKVWDEVAALFKLFKSVPHQNGSLFDATTFLVFSEFSRTPYLNGSKGKDHNPLTNSVLLAGRGIVKNKVLGASKVIPRNKSLTKLSEHVAWPYDYKEKKLAEKKEGASFFFPENLYKTVARLFNNPAGLAWIPTELPLIPGLLREET